MCMIRHPTIVYIHNTVAVQMKKEKATKQFDLQDSICIVESGTGRVNGPMSPLLLTAATSME